MLFEWDENTRQKVIRDHGVDFKDIVAAWLDGLPPSFRSDQKGEARYVGLAEIEGERWAGIFTLREDKLRFDSARKWKRKDGRKLG